MAVLVNRAKMSTSTTGTGTITLGSAVSGFQTFADAGVSDGQTVRYVIEDGANFEIGNGTYGSSGTTLSRSVIESSNSDSAISLSGDAFVFIGAIARDITSDVAITGGSIAGITDLSVAGNIVVSGTVDGVDIAARDAVLTSTTTTANAAMPTTGGTFTGDVTLLNTDGDQYAQPYVNLKRNSASPAAWDWLGGLRFYGEDGASNETLYASAIGRIVDPTNGSEDGRLEIWLAKAGATTLTYSFDPDFLRLINETPIQWVNHGGTNYEVDLVPATPTGNRTITLPDATGTVALTSDINATNVTAAGALMDSEVTNLAQVKAFDSSDYATAAQGSTADAAIPTSGGTFTGDVTVGADGAGHNVKFFGDTSGRYVEWDASEDTLYFPDMARLIFGGGQNVGAMRLHYNGTDAYIQSIQANNLIIKNQQNDQDVIIQTDNGSGGVSDYFRADGSTGEALLYHYGSQKIATKSTGISVTGNIVVSGTVDGKDVSTLTTAAAAADEATALAIALG